MYAKEIGNWLIENEKNGDSIFLFWGNFGVILAFGLIFQEKKVNPTRRISTS